MSNRFYPHSKDKDVREIFSSPTAEYRAMPFWAWNCRLDPDELAAQIADFPKMGYGGFFMHPRSGLDTKYLGEEFFGCVRRCVDEAERLGLKAALYDEDRYSSGPAGGLVTADPELRERVMLLVPADTERSNPSDVLLGSYDIELDESGCLSSYKPGGSGWKLISTTENRELKGWWGGDESFIDTLNPAASERFTELVHERYKSEVGDKFGSTCPVIFSDELQHAPTPPLGSSGDKRAVLMYTPRLFDEFERRFGYSLKERLPEVVWNRSDGDRSVRYDYHRLVAELFCESYSHILADWCGKNQLPMTAHMSCEESLAGEILRGGDIFACLGEFEIPGVDVLGGTNGCPLTLLRARSAARQLGREGVMSELYGVTGWLYRFRDYKREGDFQAALGITLRVPHLAWVSMAGSGKRDYAASIGYQSTWCEKYKLLEDHYARLASVLTRGKADARVAVVHPVESAWLLWGPDDQDKARRDKLDANYRELLEKLLRAHIEFDLLSESLLDKTGCGYDTVIIPDSLRLRESTLEALSKVRKVLTLSETVRPEFAKVCTPETLLSELESPVSIRLGGVECGDYICQHRIDDERHWLFIAPYDRAGNNYRLDAKELEISLVGEYSVEEFDTLTGEVKPLGGELRDGSTVVRKALFDDDSLLLCFTPGKPVSLPESDVRCEYTALEAPDEVGYELSEPNALPLDMPEVSLDGGDFGEREYVLFASRRVRELCGYPNDLLQPYKRPDLPPEHIVRLKFEIESELETEASLAIEYFDGISIALNGESVEARPDGFFGDHAIKTIRLPKLRVGKNILVVSLPFGLKTTLEPMYLLGDFAVGEDMKLGKLPTKLRFGDIAKQGLPFYSGNLTYILPDLGRVRVQAADSAAVYTEVNGEPLCFAPFAADTDGELRITIMPGRQNTFGPLHNLHNKNGAPESYYPGADSFSAAPLSVPRGLLAKPLIFRR